MPIHDFLCRSCHAPCELLVRGGVTPVCPHCGATALDKQLSPPAPPARSPALLARARAQAAREGHFSNE